MIDSICPLLSPFGISRRRKKLTVSLALKGPKKGPNGTFVFDVTKKVFYFFNIDIFERKSISTLCLHLCLYVCLQYCYHDDKLPKFQDSTFFKRYYNNTINSGISVHSRVTISLE